MKQSYGAGSVAQLGLTVAAALLLPTMIGIAVDVRLGTAPWALLAASLIGIALATVGLARQMKKRYERLAPPSSKEEQQ